MRGPWPCVLSVRWLVRSFRARAAEKAGEGRRGAVGRGAACGEGCGPARRGWSGRGSSPARRSAWGHTLRDVAPPREPTGGPRPPGPQAATGKGRAGCRSGHPQGVGAGPPPVPPRRLVARPRLARTARGAERRAACSSGSGGSRASPRQSPPVVNCRIPGWVIPHPTLRKVELLLGLSSSPAHSPLDS